MAISRQTYRDGPYKDFFAQGVKVGNTLYMAGQVGVKSDGTAGADIVEQCSLAYEHIGKVLSQFGASADNIVEETWFVTDMAEVMGQVQQIFADRAEFYGGVPEVAQTLIGVSALVQPELKVEIKCVARIEE